jgi:hypothetical protein
MPTGCTREAVLRIGHVQFTWPTRNQIAHVVEGPHIDLIAIGAVAAPRTRALGVGPALFDDRGLRQVFDALDPFGGISSVLAWTEFGRFGGFPGGRLGAFAHGASLHRPQFGYTLSR